MPVIRFFFSPYGRFNRLSWWSLQLSIVFLVIVMAIVFVASVMAGKAPDDIDPDSLATDPAFALWVNLAILPLMWISFAAAAKRYHDRGKTAFWYLIAFIPIIGPIWQFIELGFLPGESGANNHGPQPGSRDAYRPTPVAAAPQTAPSNAPIWQKGEAAAPKKKATAPTPAGGGPRTSFGLRGA